MKRACTGSVLVVHPGPAVRATVTALLLEEGYSVATAGDGAQLLLRLAWPGLPDVVLLADETPGISTASLVSELTRAGVRTILLCPRPPGAELLRRAAGVFLEPPSPRLLARAIAEAVAGRRAGHPLWRPPAEIVPFPVPADPGPHA